MFDSAKVLISNCLFSSISLTPSMMASSDYYEYFAPCIVSQSSLLEIENTIFEKLKISMGALAVSAEAYRSTKITNCTFQLANYDNPKYHYYMMD